MEASPDSAGWLLGQRPSALWRLLIAQQSESVRLLSAALVGAGLSPAERQTWHDLSLEERSLFEDAELHRRSLPPDAREAWGSLSVRACAALVAGQEAARFAGLPPLFVQLQRAVRRHTSSAMEELRASVEAEGGGWSARLLRLRPAHIEAAAAAMHGCVAYMLRVLRLSAEAAPPQTAPRQQLPHEVQSTLRPRQPRGGDPSALSAPSAPSAPPVPAEWRRHSDTSLRQLAAILPPMTTEWRPDTIGHHTPAAAAPATSATPACYSAAPSASPRERGVWSRGWQPDATAAAQTSLAASAAAGVATAVAASAAAAARRAREGREGGRGPPVSPRVPRPPDEEGAAGAAMAAWPRGGGGPRQRRMRAPGAPPSSAVHNRRLDLRMCAHICVRMHVVCACIHVCATRMTPGSDRWLDGWRTLHPPPHPTSHPPPRQVCRRSTGLQGSLAAAGAALPGRARARGGRRGVRQAQRVHGLAQPEGAALEVALPCWTAAAFRVEKLSLVLGRSFFSASRRCLTPSESVVYARRCRSSGARAAADAHYWQCQGPARSCNFAQQAPRRAGSGVQAGSEQISEHW